MKKQPILFIGHGSPMNAIENNVFTQSWSDIGKSLEKPRAILMLSAHWITEGETRMSSARDPQMIYDMYGFPPELYRFRYTAPGSPEIAEEIVSVIARNHPVAVDDDAAIQSSERTELLPASQGRKQEKAPTIILDPTRGLDHGIWSVLAHMFPTGDIPVISLSLDYDASPRELYELGQSLAILRNKGILIIGSGNIVHNLRMIDSSGTHIYPWAREFDEKIARHIETCDYDQILDWKNWGEISRLAHPSDDHLLPLFPLLGMVDPSDSITFSTPVIEMGSLSMRSVRWG